MITDKNNQLLVLGGFYSNSANQFTCIDPHPASSEAFCFIRHSDQMQFRLREVAEWRDRKPYVDLARVKEAA